MRGVWRFSCSFDRRDKGRGSRPVDEDPFSLVATESLQYCEINHLPWQFAFLFLLYPPTRIEYEVFVKRIALCLAAVLAFAQCGKVVESVVAEDVLVDGVLTIDRGSFLSYPFTIDFGTMSAPRILAGFSSDGGTTLVQVLILTEGNFGPWERGEPYVSAIESPQLSGTSFDWSAPTNGVYRVVFSNRSDTADDKLVAVFASLFWQPAN
jgi:hypothetical protein